MNDRFTTLETESETKWQEFKQQIDDDIRKIDSQQKDIQLKLKHVQFEINSLKDAQETLVKNTKSTRSIAYMATGLSILGSRSNLQNK